MSAERPRFHFGPLERRGLIAGWRGGQIASVAAGLVVAVLALHARPSPASVAVALGSVLGGVAFACWPVGGRTGEEWLPTVTRWGVTGLGGRRRSLLPVAGAGHVAVAGAPPDVSPAPPARRGAARPGAFGGLELLELAPPGGGPATGVVVDRRARTYTVVLAVRGHSFALLGPEEKDRRAGGWATVLASLARERSPVHRLQWVATTLPDDGEAVRGHLAARSVLAPDSPAHRSYRDLLGAVGAATCRHQVHLAVQVNAGRSTSRAVRAAGGGDAGAGAVTLGEVANLRRILGDADVEVEAVLGAPELAGVLRGTGLAGPPAAGTPAGPAAGPPWPAAVEEEWGCVRTEATWHATYWIAEWPRVDVGPDFLGPLLLGPVRRSVAVVMEPVSPGRAVRQVEQARTADLADSELRRRGGFLATARRAREAELVTRREEELADGHASFRFSGYVTVTAPDRDLLATACERTEQAAGQCRLELRRLWGDQERALTCTMPLGRGLS